MARRILAALLFAVAGPGICLAVEEIKPADPNEGWKVASNSGGVTIYSRPRAGTKLKEFKAVGAIEAPNRVARAVIADFEAYPTFMPYTVECRLIKKEDDAVISYQRLSPKLVSDRDYTLRVRWTSRTGDGGPVYVNRWEPANQLGPPEKPGVLRVKICEGGWTLEPDGPNKTRATYTIFTDSGGAIPSFLANKVSEMGIGKLFAAVRKQVKNPKYNAAER